MAKKTQQVHEVFFRVPNTKTGQNWIKNARKYINRDRFSTILARPRGPRGGDYECSVDSATGFGIYLRENETAKAEHNNYMERNYIPKYKHQEDLAKLQQQATKTINRHLGTIHEMQNDSITHCRTIDSLVKRVRYWQLSTLGASVIFSLIGYFING